MITCSIKNRKMLSIIAVINFFLGLVFGCISIFSGAIDLTLAAIFIINGNTASVAVLIIDGVNNG